MKKLLCLLLFSFLFFFLPRTVFAVTTTITEVPSVIGNDVFTVSVVITGAASGTNYVRIDIYKEGTTTYFGETFNGFDWYSGSDGKQYLPAIIPSETPFVIQGKIGETIPKSYDGTGEYRIRIRRYTAGGNYNNEEAKASATPITLSFPTPTLTPTVTPSPTKTLTPTKVPTIIMQPTSGKSNEIQQVSSTKAVLGTQTNVRNVSVTKVASKSALPTPILHASQSATPTKKEEQTVLVKGTTRNYTVIGSFVIGGVLFVACAILIFLRNRRQHYGEE